MCSQYDRGSHGSSSGHLSPGDKLSIFDTWGNNPLKNDFSFGGGVSHCHTLTIFTMVIRRHSCEQVDDNNGDDHDDNHHDHHDESR